MSKHGNQFGGIPSSEAVSLVAMLEFDHLCRGKSNKNDATADYNLAGNILGVVVAGRR
jgi:hypothetical protein